MGYTRDFTKEELIQIILNRRGENNGGNNPDGSLTYLELRHHKLMKHNKNELRVMAQALLEMENN